MRTILVGAVSLSACIWIAPGASIHAAPSPPAPAEAIERLLRPEGPLLGPYRARRVLEASTMGGKMKAAVEAWTSVDTDGRFHFEITRQNGSALIRERVLIKALETEQRSQEPGERGRAALSAENYAFSAIGPVAGGLVAIGLRPHTPNKMLLNGIVTVRPETGEIDRLDGSLSDTPSWWTRHVDIARRYARVAGVSVPVEMSSRADVRVAGESFFRMTYEYVSVNGQAVSPP